MHDTDMFACWLKNPTHDFIEKVWAKRKMSLCSKLGFLDPVSDVSVHEGFYCKNVRVPVLFYICGPFGGVTCKLTTHSFILMNTSSLHVYLQLCHCCIC